MCEYASVYRESEPVARKAHRCDECLGAIPVGERYHYGFGVWEGEPQTYHICADCWALRERIDTAAEPVPFGELLEAIEGDRDMSLITEFRRIKVKRGAKVPKWMEG